MIMKMVSFFGLFRWWLLRWFRRKGRGYELGIWLHKDIVVIFIFYKHDSVFM